MVVRCEGNFFLQLDIKLIKCETLRDICHYGQTCCECYIVKCYFCAEVTALLVLVTYVVHRAV